MWCVERRLRTGTELRYMYIHDIMLMIADAQDARNRNIAANLVSKVTGQVINQSAVSGEWTKNQGIDANISIS